VPSANCIRLQSFNSTLALTLDFSEELSLPKKGQREPKPGFFIRSKGPNRGHGPLGPPIIRACNVVRAIPQVNKE